MQAKFHEIRDEMAETRRARSLQTGTTADERIGGRSYAFEDADPSPRSPLGRSSSFNQSASTASPSPHMSVIQPHSPTRTFFWDRGRDRVETQRLECIEEGVASSWASSFDFPPVHSLPVTSTVHRQGTSSFSAATPNNTWATDESDFTGTHQVESFGSGMINKASGTALAVQSCPASIHTSPVLRAAEIPPMAHHDPPTVFSGQMFSASLQHMPAHSYPTPQQLGLNLDQGSPPLRIAEPAAPNPFALSTSPTTLGSPIGIAQAHHRDSVASALSALSNLSPPSSASTNLAGDQPGPAWHGDTIDPRWVSPATSQWSTPNGSPRLAPVLAPGMLPGHANGYY